MGSPSIFVYDCSNAGIIVKSFKQFALQREQELEVTHTHMRKHTRTHTYTSVHTCADTHAGTYRQTNRQTDRQVLRVQEMLLVTHYLIALMWAWLHPKAAQAALWILALAPIHHFKLWIFVSKQIYIWIVGGEHLILPVNRSALQHRPAFFNWLFVSLPFLKRFIGKTKDVLMTLTSNNHMTWLALGAPHQSALVTQS